jgi:hypothetical protein
VVKNKNKEMSGINRAAALILAIAGLVSCDPIEKLPPEPSIKFTSFQVFDTTDDLGNDIKGGRLKFYFEDGDGDIGLKAPGNGVIDTVNLFFSLFRKTPSGFIPAPPDDILKPSGYRIPYMERTGQNKILKGTISVTLLYLFYQDTDTIRYDFYITDRALHESNTATTCTVILGKNGFCTQ